MAHPLCHFSVLGELLPYDRFSFENRDFWLVSNTGEPLVHGTEACPRMRVEGFIVSKGVSLGVTFGHEAAEEIFGVDGPTLFALWRDRSSDVTLHPLDQTFLC